MKTRTPCCGYEPSGNVPYPVFWNPYNAVVQCHNCGQVYEPKGEDTNRLRWLILNSDVDHFMDMPEDFGQARQFIDSLILEGGKR